MCGRYRLSRRKQLVEEYFDTASDEPEWSPRYNIAPTQPVPVIRQHPKEPVHKLSLMKWGLIPSWSKDPSAAARMINARSETASATGFSGSAIVSGLIDNGHQVLGLTRSDAGARSLRSR
jgi:putative SOS response-associated peptidase YedK